MSDLARKPQPDDELREHVRQRLADEGFPPERAEALAAALLDPESQPGALDELEGRLDRLTDVLERLATDVEHATEVIETAGRPVAAAPVAAPPESAPRNGHENVRHPVRAVEREVEHLHEVVDEGKSPATPAILIGSVATVAAVVIAILIALAFGIAYLVTRGDDQSTIAPAFSADELTALPTDNWITNGGSLANQRYSPLTEIDTTNVSRLQGVWLTHLRKSGVDGKYSAEGQPLEYEGVLYVPTGADDVFAVDVETGKILWQYQARLDQKITSVCCGWDSRGVALGDGKVYIGQLDGKLVALDQETGKLAWSTQLARWQDGYTITSAPLYYDGRVYSGVSGGEFQIRGRVTAFDAKTGKELWRFSTLPGPGEVGHDTWPETGDAWKNGGAPVWQTPAVDPELGLLYFSTGNASPDDDGHVRPGDNLFSSSIVAIDAATGKYRWHFQEVHHDIWDYDAPNPVVLFDVRVNGTLRHAIAQSGKTGWTYFLDRTNGKPLYGITEKPVPQNAEQATSKTQPFPSNPPVIPQQVTDKAFAGIAKLASENAATKGLKLSRATTMFTPVTKRTVTVVSPSPIGGTNWPPSSYNPDTQLLYVCAQAGVGGLTYGLTKPPDRPGSASYVGSIWTIGPSENGTIAAIDVRSGAIKWQTNWPEPCYSGSTTTAGNLVFVGRNNGELQALDARTGKQLWSFQTGAGANNTATVFEHNGRQYVAFYAGGSALGASAHGDNLWLFSLDGKLGSVQEAEQTQGIHHAGEATTSTGTATTPTTPTTTAATGNAAAGQTVFASNCSICHGATGQGGNGGPNLTTIPGASNLQTVIAQVTNGGGGMPPFKGTLTEQQINDVAAYVTAKIAKKK